MKYLRITTNRRTGEEIRRDEVTLEGSELFIEQSRYSNAHTLSEAELINKWNEQAEAQTAPIRWSYVLLGQMDFHLYADRGGVKVEPLTEAAKSATKAYKGVFMNKFFMPNSLLDGFLKFAATKFNACMSCTKN